MTRYYASLLALSMVLLSGCQPPAPVCPPPTGTPQYLTEPPAYAPPGPSPAPAQIDIGGRTLRVDKVVEGPLCNDAWSGTVYVACDVQVLEWKDQPTFLKGCNLEIDPGTVVYVAYHNDAPYYNGCSCHTGEELNP